MSFKLPFKFRLTTPGRNTELDFVRGIAILLVIGYHAHSLPTNNRIFQFLETIFKIYGWSGVDLFFVLSGFLVGGLLLNEYKKTNKLDIKRFIIRRGLKIWPPYYFYLLFQVISHRHPIRSYLVANLFHIQNYVGSSLEHTWTLSLEEHFYLLLSFTLGFMALRKWPPQRIIKTFVVCLFVVFALRCITWFLGFPNLAQHATHARIDSLLSGVILAVLFQFFPERFERLARRKLPLVLLFSAAVVFLAVVDNQYSAWVCTIGYSILYVGYCAFMLLGFRHSNAIKHFVAYKIVARIGVYSYGIYLWHLSVRDTCAHFANHFSPSFRWPVAMVCQYVTAIILGALITRIIEWPSLRLRDRIFPAKDRFDSSIADSPRSNAASKPVETVEALH